MKPETRSSYGGSVPEFAGVIVATVLCGIALVAHSQTATPAPPTTAIAVDGRAKPAPEPQKVLADPDTKMYAKCMAADDQPAPDSNQPKYVRPPKAQVMTEEAAKAGGFRPSAHKVSCD
jgi:hypothetical protein